MPGSFFFISFIKELGTGRRRPNDAPPPDGGEAKPSEPARGAAPLCFAVAIVWAGTPHTHTARHSGSKLIFSCLHNTCMPLGMIPPRLYVSKRKTHPTQSTERTHRADFSNPASNPVGHSPTQPPQYARTRPVTPTTPLHSRMPEHVLTPCVVVDGACVLFFVCNFAPDRLRVGRIQFRVYVLLPRLWGHQLQELSVRSNLKAPSVAVDGQPTPPFN